MDPATATIAELQRAMASGAWSAQALTSWYRERIARAHRLGAVIAVDDGAIAQARRLDAERAAGRVRGPLHGVPLLLKDNIETAGPTATTCGSLALEGFVAARDSGVAHRLRRAGAVLLGKTNLSEWANFRSLGSTSGWSAVGGQCRNAYDLERSPGGSSSGSAVAVAAGLCAAAIGTETDGSIVGPAAMNGIVGLKPGIGLVSRAGLVPIAPSQDTAGPMARTVADAALLLAAIVGADARDPATDDAPDDAGDLGVAALATSGLGGVRVGAVRSGFALDDEEARVFEGALDALRGAGATVVDGVTLPAQSEVMPLEIPVLLYEFKAAIDAYLAGLGAASPVRSLAELIAFNERHREREMPHFGQDIFHAAVEKGPLTSPEYRDARRGCLRVARDEGLDAALRLHGCAALVAPTTGVAGRIDLGRGDDFRGSNSSLPAVAGYPSLTVPAGFARGLPFGVLFVGGARSEAVLLRIAAAFERSASAWRPPAGWEG